jgi:hypothetical protein
VLKVGAVNPGSKGIIDNILVERVNRKLELHS